LNTEFYTDAQRGEFWIGTRPDLKAFSGAVGLQVKPLAELESDLSKRLPLGSRTYRISDQNTDEKLQRTIDEMRLVKDNYEIGEIKRAIEITKNGFEKVIAEIPQLLDKPRSERSVEGIFYRNAIEQGNNIGYDTIAASGENATTLHWTRNIGTLKSGELLLLDAGAEVDSLYTADITRTIPLSGHFNKFQRDIYELVLRASNAAFEQAKPGNKFIDMHNAALEVIAEGLIALEIIKDKSLKDVLNPEIGGEHRRWMCHGTSHHLGLDVHDCAKARRELYVEGILEPGMVFTIEPGLYFKSDDELVPAQYRGIGIRIEDNVLITEDGYENLSQSFPKNTEHLESWIATIWQNNA
jgi:Xaa-Pro aminopeptidase